MLKYFKLNFKNIMFCHVRCMVIKIVICFRIIVNNNVF